MPPPNNPQSIHNLETPEGVVVAYRRIVIKAGTTLLTHDSDHLNTNVMLGLVKQITNLHQNGVEAVLVSSGAVAAGYQVLNLSRKEKNLPFRQVLAAAGQSHLMHLYQKMFDDHGIPVAQALLSRKDFNERVGYLNIRNTLLSLLNLKVVPIINENDVVAVDELVGEAFGDNDNLSAMVANLIDADLLIMLGEVDGLYTSDPHIDSNARLIPTVTSFDSDIDSMGGASWGDRGQGGMITKLESAKLATASGIDVVIANGMEHDALMRLASGERLGTLFPASSTKMESRKRWMLSGLSTKGEMIVDEGASRALSDKNRSLLPAGVKSVLGSFHRGDIVAILSSRGNKIAVGITNYGSDEVEKIRGSHTNLIGKILGHQYGDEVVHRNNMVIL